ncbi:MAG: DUF362 domain-containing protein [Aminipila sp.]
MEDNRTSLNKKQVAFIDGKKCVGCGSCKRNCPEDAINRGSEFYIVNKDKCVGCGICITKCPADAISYLNKNQ